MTNKPTSKIIQISETVHQGSFELTVLCADGSIWYFLNPHWMCMFKPKDNIRHKTNNQTIYELAKSLMELTEKYTTSGTNKVMQHIESPILGELGLLTTHSTDKGISFSWKLNWEHLERFKKAKND